jgi:hypothetical protein
MLDVAFAAILSILGLGAAGLLGSGIINTTKEIRNSISLLRMVGPMAQLGGSLWKGRKAAGEWLKQRDNILLKGLGHFLTLPETTTSFLFNKSRKRRQETQDTQGKQEGQGGGGSGNPPVPPDTKSDNKQDTQGKQEGQGGGGSDKKDGQGRIIPFEEFIKKRQQLDGGGDNKSPPFPPTA